MNLLHFKRILGRLWAFTLTQRNRRIVLFYHAVGYGPNAISQQLFQSQMEWLSKNADVLALDDLLAGVGSKPIRVSIGFDDGYASVVDNAEPILHALNMSATVYLNTGWIGGAVRRDSAPALGHYPREQFMTWKDVDRLAKRRWTIGSHGVEHFDLTTVNADSLASELFESKKSIEAQLDITCQHFAYTWGKFNKNVQYAAVNAGYRTAASALHGPITSQCNLFALPRIDIQKIYSLDDFQAIVRGQWDYLGIIQKLKRLIHKRLWRSD
jgi:peptidoglycan/xylan/chitin deacetylase (PgdA/CDA1 family)